MMDHPLHEDTPLPKLMLEARGSYGEASRRALAAAGCEDLPRGGGMLLAGLEDIPEADFTPQADAVAGLHRSKQAASQLIDALVIRGYLERRSDPGDRRRMRVRITDRGRAAASVIQAAVDAVDAALEQRITAEELHGLRVGLAALGEIRAQSAG
jgi:DNA-binding MarR family transcriptional regulator